MSQPLVGLLNPRNQRDLTRLTTTCPGANFVMWTNGTSGLNWGTSVAAPIWASLLTLINEERTAIGKGGIGFVNPVLYKNPQIFHDITEGSNPGCGTKGFSAVPGWDPATASQPVVNTNSSKMLTTYRVLVHRIIQPCLMSSSSCERFV